MVGREINFKLYSLFMEIHVANEYEHNGMHLQDERSHVIAEVPLNLPQVIKQSEANPEEAIVSMNGSQFYFDEWNQLFKQVNYLSIIRNRAFTGGLRSCRYRSICWKVFLHCLSDEQCLWLQESQLARAQYEELKSKILINPRLGTKLVDPFINNPLSQEESSPWNQYFLDTELKLTINQDVIRTFPEIEFFQLPEVREIMVNILFCYAREHPQISYRQGMHELLAPLIFVLHSDQQAFLHADEIDFTDFFDKYQKETLKYLLNDEYLEHDAYSMFCNMMDHVEAWYLIRDTNPSKKHPKPTGYNHLMLRHVPTVGGRPDVHRAPLSQRSTSMSHEEFLYIKPKVVLSGISSLSRKVTNRPKSLAVNSNFWQSTTEETHSAIETKSQSPSTDIGENAHTECHSRLGKIPLDLDKNASISRSNPALANLETELKPIRIKYGEKSSTLPRSFGIHGKSKEVLVEDESNVETRKTFTGSAQVNVNNVGPLASLTQLASNQHSNPNKSGNNIPVQDLHKQLAYLQSQTENMQTMSVYCADKMTSHIDSLQECIFKQRLENEDKMLIALAGMKQVRDILKGTLKFSQNMVDED